MSTSGVTDPIGSCHLHNDLNSRLVKEASISPHHHCGTLTVTEVNGGEDTLDEVVQIVPPGLEDMDLSSQTVGTRSLVSVRGCRDSQHSQRTVVHLCFEIFTQCSSRQSERKAVVLRERITGTELLAEILTPPLISPTVCTG